MLQNAVKVLWFPRVYYVSVAFFFLLISKSMILQKRSTNIHTSREKICRIFHLKFQRIVDSLFFLWQFLLLLLPIIERKISFAMKGCPRLHDSPRNCWNAPWPGYIFLLLILKKTWTYEKIKKICMFFDTQLHKEENFVSNAGER